MTRHTRTLIGAAIVGAAVTAAVLLHSRKVEPAPRLPPSQYLDASVRGFLDKRMAHHARDMNAVVQAVILLDFKTAADSAERVANDASLARPLANDASELNALVPPRFFELQDELRASAKRVSSAARSENIDALADAYAEMTRACITCHGVYLKGAPPASR